MVNWFCQNSLNKDLSFEILVRDRETSKSMDKSQYIYIYSLAYKQHLQILHILQFLEVKRFEILETALGF